MTQGCSETSMQQSSQYIKATIAMTSEIGPEASEGHGWFRADVTNLLSKYKQLSTEDLQRVKAEYKGLINQRTLKIKPENYHLVFDEDDDDESLELTTAQLSFLIGPDWKGAREEYLKQKQGKPKVISHGFKLALDTVPEELCMTAFNILASQNSTKIKVRTANGAALCDIPPVVNLAIALTLIACRIRGRGLFLWQAKLRKGAKNDAKWHIIPDLLFLDYIWHSDDRAAFLKSSYERQRDFLDAAMRLASDDLVLPFVVDFPKAPRRDETLAQVTAHVDGKQPPLAAISIPGACFIGWISDMMLPRKHSQYKDRCVHPCDPYGSSQYRLSTLQKGRTRVKDLEAMYQRVISMFDDPIAGALVFYETIMEWLETAERHMEQQSEVDGVNLDHSDREE